MNYQDTTKSLKINFNKPIGTVVLVVEGEKDEFVLFQKIFCNILHYRLITHTRRSRKFKEYNEFVSSKNRDSKIIVLNTSESNIGKICDDSYRNEVFKLLYQKYDIDIKNVPVYYVWDRDASSNQAELTKHLLSILTHPYDNGNYENGLLLLSYPAIESYLIANFEKSKWNILEPLKKYVKKKMFYITYFNQHTILCAALEMIKGLQKLGVRDFHIDEMKRINMEVFELEENYYSNHQYYFLLSLVSILFLDLGILSFRDN